MKIFLFKVIYGIVLFIILYNTIVEYTLSHLKVVQVNDNDGIIVMTFYNQTWIYEYERG